MTLPEALAAPALLPHGFCFLWQSGLLWLHVVSDAVIALAYYSIPVSLIYLLRKRRGTPYDWVLAMFGVFIVFCGTTHVLEIVNIWTPAYWLAGYLKAATAIVSLATAVTLVPALPKLIALPSPILDNLTALPNRLLFVDRLQVALARLRRAKAGRVAVLFVDLDGFKAVNDRYGHARGDQLLVAVACRLRESVRPADTVARFGGDEFLVLLESVDDPVGAQQTAHRMIGELERPFGIGPDSVSISASVGIALSESADDAAEELIRKADRAMYLAKAARRGTYRTWEGVATVAT